MASNAKPSETSDNTIGVAVQTIDSKYTAAGRQLLHRCTARTLLEGILTRAGRHADKTPANGSDLAPLADPLTALMEHIELGKDPMGSIFRVYEALFNEFTVNQPKFKSRGKKKATIGKASAFRLLGCIETWCGWIFRQLPKKQGMTKIQKAPAMARKKDKKDKVVTTGPWRTVVSIAAGMEKTKHKAFETWVWQLVTIMRRVDRAIKDIRAADEAARDADEVDGDARDDQSKVETVEDAPAIKVTDEDFPALTTADAVEDADGHVCVDGEEPTMPQQMMPQQMMPQPVMLISLFATHNPYIFVDQLGWPWQLNDGRPVPMQPSQMMPVHDVCTDADADAHDGDVSGKDDA